MAIVASKCDISITTCIIDALSFRLACLYSDSLLVSYFSLFTIHPGSHVALHNLSVYRALLSLHYIFFCSSSHACHNTENSAVHFTSLLPWTTRSLLAVEATVITHSQLG